MENKINSLPYLVKKKYLENKRFALFLKILFIMLVSRFLMLVMMLVYNIYNNGDYSISFLMNQWDAKRYQFMIDNWYTFPLDTDPQANWAFFPMYVIVCRFVKFLTFGLMDTYWTGMIVSNICIFTAAFFSVLLMQKRYGEYKKDYILIPILMYFAPYTFYFASVYTESMFVMFIVLFFYFCSEKKFMAAGLMSAFASATRIVGCLLVFSLIIEIIHDVKSKKKLESLEKYIFSVMICPLGAFLYMTFLKFFCGDPWAFKNVQIAWREDEFFPVIGVLWKACTGQIEPRYTYMGWFCVAVILLYIYMFTKKYYSMASFGILTLLVALSSHVMSTCRFTAGSFVVFVGLYDIISVMKKPLRIMIMSVLILLECYLLLRWYKSDCWLM